MAITTDLPILFIFYLFFGQTFTDEEKILILPEIDMPTLIDGTNCSGSEQRLTDCDFRFNRPFNCYLHQNDVVLQCLGRHDIYVLLNIELNSYCCWYVLEPSIVF